MVGGDRRSPPRHRGKGGGGGGGKGKLGGGAYGGGKDFGATMGVRSAQTFKVSAISEDVKTRSASEMGIEASDLAARSPVSLFMDGFGMKAVAAIMNQSNSQSQDVLKSQDEVTTQLSAHDVNSSTVGKTLISQNSSLSHDLHKEVNLDGRNLHKKEVSFCENLHKNESSFCGNLHKEEGCLCENLHKECNLCENLHKNESSFCRNLHKEEGCLCKNLHKECSLCENLHEGSSGDLVVHDSVVANSMSWAKSDAKVLNFNADLHKEGCVEAMEDDSSPKFLHKEGEMPCADAHGLHMEKPKLSSAAEINACMKTYVRSPTKFATNPRWANLVDNLDHRTTSSPCAKLFNHEGMEVDYNSAVFPNSLAISDQLTMERNQANLHISGGGENGELIGAEMNVNTNSSQGVCDNAIDKNSALLHKEQLDRFWDSRVNMHRNVSQFPVRPHSIDYEKGNEHPQARNLNMQRPNAWARPKHIRIQGEEVSSITRDGKVVTMDKDAVNHNIGKLRMALVGRLIGKKLPFNILDEELHRRWECFGEFNTVMIEADCFICTFQSHEARDAVLIGGPWQIAGHIIGLDKWTPKFKANSFSGLSSPVWIRFPHLPLMYWDATNITRIATMVGEPLWLDVQTSEWGRSAYARVCVRLELDKKLPTGVWVEGIDGDFFQRVMYEGISILCFKCGIIGHKEVHCSLNSPCTSKNGVMVGGKQQVPPNHSDSPMVDRSNEVAAQGQSAQLHDSPVNLLDTEFVGGSNIGNIDMRPLGVDECKTADLNEEENGNHGPWTMVSRRRNSTRRLKGGHRSGGNAHTAASQGQVKGRFASKLEGVTAKPRTESILKQKSVPNLHSGVADVAQGGPSSPLPTLDARGKEPLVMRDAHMDKYDKDSNLKPRAGTSRVSKAHFDKELQALGPITELPRKRKKFSSGSQEDVATGLLTNSKGQFLLTNTDGGDDSPFGGA